jgi:hypothetical protein
MTIKRLRWLLVGLVVIVMVIMLIPFESTVVPAWRIRVIDENGRPYAGQRVRQLWKHYTLETEAGQNIEDQLTDRDGYVSFPERTIKASLLRRVVLTIFSAVLILAHGSMGVDSSVMVTGEYVVDYRPGRALPEQIVIPSSVLRR